MRERKIKEIDGSSRGMCIRNTVDILQAKYGDTVKVHYTGKSEDAGHIVIATINRIDVLVSWNFRYIMNLPKIHRYNSINLKYCYPLLEIRCPQEVMTYA